MGPLPRQSRGDRRSSDRDHDFHCHCYAVGYCYGHRYRHRDGDPNRHCDNDNVRSVGRRSDWIAQCVRPDKLTKSHRFSAGAGRALHIS